MNGARDFVAAQGCDNALDLTPVTEAGNIPVIATAFCTGSSFKAGVVSILIDKVRSVRKRMAPVNEQVFHQAPLTPPTVERLRTSIVNKPFTMLGLACR